MSEQGYRRPVLITLTGIAATAILVFAYYQYSHEPVTTGSSLHRSNAIHRPRRQWRRGHPPRDLGHNACSRAVNRLQVRVENGRSYGRYDNRALFNVEEGLLENGVFDLLPGNVEQIYNMLVRIRPLDDEDKDRLRLHINSLFVQNFLDEEFPSGYILSDEDLEFLLQHLTEYGVDEKSIQMMVQNFNARAPSVPNDWGLQDEPRLVETDAILTVDGAADSASSQDNVTAQDAIEALTGSNARDGSDSSEDENESDPGGSQNMLDLLYHIASEQAKREGFIHRDVQCNGCNTKPIQGVRYHCANCYDFDLCEDCEAQQVHNKNHVFYKVRIPAPPRGHIKQIAPVWYPGRPNAFPDIMPRDLQKRLVEEVGMDKTEMEASYEQFKCLAGQHMPIDADPARIGMAISRQNFDMFFTPTSTDRPPPPNLIYDRIFAFYDFHNDGVITLDEYIIGIFTILDRSRGARLKRMFMGYDLDGDGYVDRRDFLRMFRAYYALSKELNKEMISLQDDLDDDIRDVVQGSQPVSAAFSGHYFVGHVSRGGQDKEQDTNGDLEISDGPNGVLQNELDMRAERSRAIGNVAVRDRTRTHPFRSFRQPPEYDEQLLFLPYTSFDRNDSNVAFADDVEDESLVGHDAPLHVYGWPPHQPPTSEDIVSALGVDIPVDDVTDPVDRSRVIYAQAERMDEESDRILDAERAAAIRERWRRRQFYLDEEEGLGKPPGYTEPDSSEDDEAASIDESPDPALQTSTSSRRQSMRSRSSSKVRFDDSAIDTDYETRSNTSSRSIPVNERWGGFELSEAERDIGREVLYQAVQQGFNELLDPLFKKKEDEAMEAMATKSLRTKMAKEIDAYEASLKKQANDKEEALKQADMLRTEALLSTGIGSLGDPAVETDSLQAPVPEAEGDESDHIKIMFGNSGAIIEEVEPLTQHGGDLPENLLEATEERSEVDDADPTLPQNKPNDPAFIILLISPSGSLHTHTPSSSTSASSEPSPPTTATLKLWLRHRKIDTEAKVRGGYGRLSYREFRRAMIREADKTDMADTVDETDNVKGKGGVRGGASDGNSVVEDDNDDTDDEVTWSSTADLGKMSFCGAWLEMAQF